MFSERVFQIALIISLAMHGAILFQNLDFVIFTKAKNEQKLEITYIKKPVMTEKSEFLRRAMLKEEPFLKLYPKITVKNKTPPPFTLPLHPPSGFIKPTLLRPDIITIKKKISLPPVDLEKINNPSYISYYQIVREKIKRAAYQNYTRNETGEVYLSFTISSSGELKGMKLVEEKTSSSQYLKNVALKSISDAAAFPHFPHELDYPQLSFNVIISFEID
jgi:outer membrane biosynthesis protein TonB